MITPKQHLVISLFKEAEQRLKEDSKNFTPGDIFPLIEQFMDNEVEHLQEIFFVALTTALPDESENMADIVFFSLEIAFRFTTEIHDGFPQMRVLTDWIEQQLAVALRCGEDLHRIRRVILCAIAGGYEFNEVLLEYASEADNGTLQMPDLKAFLTQAIQEIIAHANACSEWELLNHLSIAATLQPTIILEFIVPTLLEMEEPWRNCAMLLTIDRIARTRKAALMAWRQPGCQKFAGNIDLKRFVSVRRWLPDQEQKQVDQIIKGLQRIRIGGALFPTSRASPVSGYITSLNNQGNLLVLVLFQCGDQWVVWRSKLRQHAGQSKGALGFYPDRESAENYFNGLSQYININPIPVPAIQLLLRHFLQYNHTSGTIPSSDLLWLMEHAEGDWLESGPFIPNKFAGSLKEYGELLEDQWDFAADMRKLTTGWIHPVWLEYETAEQLITQRFALQRDIWLERFLITSYIFQQQCINAKEIKLLLQASIDIMSGKPLINISLMREMAEAAFHSRSSV